MTGTLRCRFDHVEADGRRAVELHGPVAQLEATALSDVAAVLREVEAAARGGRYAAGFVAYEAAAAFDPALASRPPSARVPLAWFGVFSECRDAPALAAPEPSPDLLQWSCEIEEGEHAAGVAAIREAIAAGDVYVLNYTTRFRRSWSGDPFALYRRLVAGHAGGDHAYLETDEWAVACGSPELFFDWDDGRLTTRPMKGTAERGRWSEEDLASAEALRNSDKERAENVMIVDLLRNDLGRIAVPGRVDVPRLWEVERHPTVWQLTSTVTATPRPGVGLAEIFGALFPSGSVTGAPKVSAMRAIAGLERSARGVYCGAVGLVRPGSAGVSARFGVAIRTAVVDKAAGVAEYGSGGGITWDSSPAAEWDEVAVKTGALRAPAAAGGLIETMAFDPARAGDAGCGVRNLKRHLDRLAASAAYLGFPDPVEASQSVAAAVAACAVASRVRLVLGRDGTIDVSVSALPGPPGGVQRLCVDPSPVSSRDPALFHKTTDRARYDERARRHPHADDVVLVNERGEVTETTRANLAVRIDGRWATPPLDCGLLPGVGRSRLVEDGTLAERVVTVDELRRAEAVATVSSLRGWRASRLVECRP